MWSCGKKNRAGVRDRRGSRDTADGVSWAGRGSPKPASSAMAAPSAIVKSLRESRLVQ